MEVEDALLKRGNLGSGRPEEADEELAVSLHLVQVFVDSSLGDDEPFVQFEERDLCVFYLVDRSQVQFHLLGGFFH